MLLSLCVHSWFLIRTIDPFPSHPLPHHSMNTINLLTLSISSFCLRVLPSVLAWPPSCDAFKARKCVDTRLISLYSNNGLVVRLPRANELLCYFIFMSPVDRPIACINNPRITPRHSNAVVSMLTFQNGDAIRIRSDHHCVSFSCSNCFTYLFFKEVRLR